MDEVAERGALMHRPVGEEVGASDGAAREGEKHGRHHVLDIDEGDVLLLEANGEVGVALDALRHHEVVVLPGTIDARGTEDDDGQSALQRRLFGLQFAPAIAGVGARLVGRGDRRVGLGLVDGAKDAEARQEDDALHGHRQRPDGLEEVARAVQQTLASVRDNDAAGALWVQRELLQLTGDPYASMLPVVFTCGLGLVADGVSTTDFSFGTLGRVRSQTPQTLLDLQVHEDVKGLHLTADYVTQALDAQRVQDAISAVAQRICDCAERVHGAQAVAAGAADAAGDGAAAAGGVAGAAASITTPADQLATSPADNPATVLADQPTADTVPVTAASAADLTGPAADLYAQIAPLWEAALEGVAVTLDSNFFKEGGDSLRATMVTRQVQDTTGREVDLRILLTNPTLRDYLQAVSAVPAATATEVGELDDYPNSPGSSERAGAGVVVGTLPHGGDQADSSLADADLEEGTL